jgi:hypothetical protein
MGGALAHTSNLSTRPFQVVCLVALDHASAPTFYEMATTTRRLEQTLASLSTGGATINGVAAGDYKAKLAACKDELEAFISKMNCNPIMVRLRFGRIVASERYRIS